MQPVNQPTQPSLSATPSLRALSFSRSADGNYAGRSTSLLGSIGVAATRLLTPTETGGSHGLHLITLQPGASWTALASSTENTVYYVVEGQPTLCLGDQYLGEQSDQALGAFVPKGTRFALQNDGQASAARVLRLSMPASSIADAPYLIRKETGFLVELSTHRSRAIVSAKDSQGALLWADVQTKCGANVPLHVHRYEDETFYVISGRFVLEAGDALLQAGPGSVVFGPRNIAHSWRCVSEEGGRVQALVTPGENFETFARTMAERGVVPARDMTDPVLASQLMALSAHHGIQMLTPPTHHIK